MLKVTEIFFSIQGESKTIGLPTVFIRLTGCPMRCVYCDTDYAFHGGEKLSIEQIIGQVSQYETNYITVTGGEPLAQPACIDLLNELCKRGYKVSLETGNAIDISRVDSRVYVVLDIKTPGSGEEKNNQYSNLSFVKSSDSLKFVICDEADYQWSKTFVNKNELSGKCDLLFSPSAEQLSATELADWIVRDQLAVRMQIQLHKALWGSEQGR